MSQYLVIIPRTTCVMGAHWSTDYETMRTEAARLGGVVSSAAWLRNCGIGNPLSGLRQILVPTVSKRKRRARV